MPGLEMATLSIGWITIQFVPTDLNFVISAFIYSIIYFLSAALKILRLCWWSHILIFLILKLIID